VENWPWLSDGFVAVGDEIAISLGVELFKARPE
jgi:hypothetical protein